MTDMQAYGYVPYENTEESGIARITAVHKERYEIVCAYGLTYAKLKSSIYFNDKEYMEFPTTGDFVKIQYNPQGDSLITRTLKRRSYFSRRDPSSGGRAEQAVAANFDYVFILMSLNFDFNPRRLERYLTLSWNSGAMPVIVLTKADLTEDPDEHVREVEEIAIGVDIHVISAKSRYGLDELSKYMQPCKTIVFLGSSGVGKSSLVNAIAGEELMSVKEIREDDSKGRHTTSYRQLIMMKNGAMIIDTPGMREIGVWDVSEGLEETFSDVTRYFGQCRFSDCRHDKEPGCAIKKALREGLLQEDRWNSYKKLAKEARFSSKEEALKSKEEFFKTIAKKNKQKK